MLWCRYLSPALSEAETGRLVYIAWSRSVVRHHLKKHKSKHSFEVFLRTAYTQKSLKSVTGIMMLLYSYSNLFIFFCVPVLRFHASYCLNHLTSWIGFSKEPSLGSLLFFLNKSLLSIYIYSNAPLVNTYFKKTIVKFYESKTRQGH